MSGVPTAAGTTPGLLAERLSAALEARSTGARSVSKFRSLRREIRSVSPELAAELGQWLDDARFGFATSADAAPIVDRLTALEVTR